MGILLYNVLYVKVVKKMLEKEITLEDKELLNSYLNAFEHKSSGLSFSSLYMWRNINKFRYEIINGYLCIAGYSQLEDDKEDPFLFVPLTKSGFYDLKSLSETIDVMRQRFEENGYIFSIRLLPFHMADIFEKCKPSAFEFIPDRPNYDYVYLAKDLIELKGKKFHSKKNHLNHFKMNYNFEYVPITSSKADEYMTFIRDFNQKFNQKKEIPEYEMKLLKMEEDVMEDVFKNIETVGYVGGVILIDNKIEALSLGGKLGKRTITVHIEKANTDYRGLYQAINNEFCRHCARSVKYVNREEDMGLPGLRKAKSSYHPVRMIEKYILMFKEDL